MSLKLFELLDINRGQIYQDFTDGNEIRKAWWGFQPYNPPDGPAFVNEEFVNLVEKRDNFIMRKPIFHMFTLAEEFKKAKKNINECLKKAKNPFKFYSNLVDLEESLMKHGYCEERELMLEQQGEPQLPMMELERAKADELVNHVVREIGLGNPKYVGGGSYGHAYKVGEDQLFKITTDPSEADAALKIRSFRPKHIASVYNVWKIVDTDENKYYYGILSEFVDDKRPDYFHSLLNDFQTIADAAEQPDFVRLIKRHYRKNFNYEELLNGLKYILTANPELNISDERRKEVYNFMVGIVNIMNDLNTMGLNKIDDFSNMDNLGIEDGILKFFDVGGVMSTPPPDLPPDQTIMKEYMEEKRFTKDISKKIVKFMAKKLNLPKTDYIATGMFGDAYDIGNNMVMKFTTDNTEAINSAKIRGKKMGHIANIYNVYQLNTREERYPQIFVIILEKLRVDPTIKTKMERLKYAFENIIGIYDYKDLIDQLALGGTDIYDDFKEEIEAYFRKNPKDKEFFDQLVEISREVRKNNIESGDYFNFTNLGYKPNGSLAVFDLGFGNPFEPMPTDIDYFEIDEDGSAKFTTPNIVGADQFPPYNQKDSSPSIDNNLDANSFMYDENIQEDRKKAWIPGSKAVTVKQKCRLGGLGNTSAACNQGDISNLEFHSLKEDVKLDQGFVDGWHKYEILHNGDLAGEMQVNNNDDFMILNKIQINPEHRGMGHANDAMQLLMGYADANDKIIALTPDNVWGASKEKLKRWYKSLGFEMNKGRKVDHRTRELMIRQPQKVKQITEIVDGGEYFAYHGSTSPITKFSDEFVGREEATDQEGPGIYFTTDPDDARGYGEHVHAVKITPRKLVDETPHDDIPDDDLISLIKMAPDWEMNAQNWDEDPESGLYQAVSDFREYNESEKELFQQVWYDFFRHNPREFVRGMVNLGYDGQLINRENGRQHIIVYNPEIITTVDPLTEIILQEVQKYLTENREVLNEKDIMTLEELPFRNEIERAGGKIYAVGGSVRDSYLGKSSKDLDIVIRGIPAPELEKILSKHGRMKLVGQSFGVYKFVPEGGEEEIDIALPRTEVSTGEGHKDFKITADHRIPIEKDLERRDFTINAIAKDVNGTTIDPFNGLQDMSNGIIRVVGSDSFKDDPLRMLRAVQFSSRFGFDIEPHTLKDLKQNSRRINTVAKERIFEEFEKIVKKGDPFKGAQLLKSTGLLEALTGVDGPIYAGPHWNNVKTMAEFIYLLTHHLVPSVVNFTKNKITDDTNVLNELKGIKYGLSDEVKSNDPKENRWIAHDINDISSKALNSKLLPRLIQVAADEFKADRFPKNVNGLAVDGNDIKGMGYQGEEIGRIKEWLLDNVYAENVRNDRNDLLNLMRTLTPETVSDLIKRSTKRDIQKMNEKSHLVESKYSDVKGSIERSKSLSKEMKEKILKYLTGGSTYHEGGRVHGLRKPKVKGKSFNGVGLGADKKGFYVYTHRAASNRYESPEKIPQGDINFIESTG